MLQKCKSYSLFSQNVLKYLAVNVIIFLLKIVLLCQISALEVRCLKNFTYVAKDFTGKTIKGSYQCENSQELVNYIADKGLFCVSVTEGMSFGGRNRRGAHKFKTKELSICCRQLSSMLSSGLTLIKSLDILYKQQENKYALDTWRNIYDDVQKGLSFSEAIKAQDGAFPEFFISMISAGETSGTLDIVMTRLSEHFAKESKLKNKIKGALIYPIILLFVAIIVVIGVFTFIMPKFKEMFVDIEMPPLTKAMFKFSDFLTNYWYIVLVVFLAIIGGVVYYLKNPSTRYKFDRHLIKSRAIGKLIVKVYTGRFARTFSSLYSSGIPMVESIERSAAVLGNSYISERFVEIVDEVKQGGSLSNAMIKADIFETMFCSMVFVGEEAGTLDEIIAKTADFYEEEAESAISKLVSMIEPVMIIFLGVLIGLVVASIYPAMMSMGDNIN